GALVNLPPPGIRQTGAEFRDRAEPILLRVVDARQQRPRAKRGTLAFAEVVAKQNQVDRVVQLAAGVPFQLDPVEVPSARLVRRVGSLDDDTLQAAADVVEQD